jgi:hypothetical protein
MNWQKAVELTSWMSANLAHTLPQSRWPLGGWPTIGDSPENRAELRWRAEQLLSVPSIASGHHGGDLRSLVSELGGVAGTGEEKQEPVAEAGKPEETTAPSGAFEPAEPTEQTYRAKDESENVPAEPVFSED